jgi:hypothetical protein
MMRKTHAARRTIQPKPGGAAALPLAAILCMAGCGGGGTAPAVPAPTAAPTPAPAAAAAGRRAEPGPADAPAQTGERRDAPPVTVGALLVDPGAIHWGTVEPETRHQATFTLYNKGAAPITIKKVSTSCACTAPQNLAGRVIAPGASMPLSTEFDAPPIPGTKDAYISVVFDSGGRESAVKLEFKAEIRMAVVADPPYVDALKGVSSGQLRLSAPEGREFRVLSTDGQAPMYADGSNGAARREHVVRWSIPPRAVEQCEGMRLWWIVETDHPECPILPVEVRHDCTGGRRDLTRKQRGWYFDDYIANLRGMRAGESREVEVRIANENRVRIHEVASLSPQAHATLVSAEHTTDGKTICRVRFTPAPDARGMVYAMVEFRSDTGAKDIAFVARVGE